MPENAVEIDSPLLVAEPKKEVAILLTSALAIMPVATSTGEEKDGARRSSADELLIQDVGNEKAEKQDDDQIDERALDSPVKLRQKFRVLCQCGYVVLKADIFPGYRVKLNWAANSSE